MFVVVLPDRTVEDQGDSPWMLHLNNPLGQGIGVMLRGHVPWRHAYPAIVESWRRCGILLPDDVGVAVVHTFYRPVLNRDAWIENDQHVGELVLAPANTDGVAVTLVVKVTHSIASLLPPPQLAMLYNAVLDVELMPLLRLPRQQLNIGPGKTPVEVQIIGRLREIAGAHSFTEPRVLARVHPSRLQGPTFRRLGWRFAEAVCEGIPYGVVWAMLRHAGVDSALLTRVLLAASVMSVLAMVPRGYAHARARGR